MWFSSEHLPPTILYKYLNKVVSQVWRASNKFDTISNYLRHLKPPFPFFLEWRKYRLARVLFSSHII